MYKLVSDQLPTFMLYFDIKQIAYVSDLTGMHPSNIWWTVHEWELRS